MNRSLLLTKFVFFTEAKIKLSQVVIKIAKANKAGLNQLNLVSCISQFALKKVKQTNDMATVIKTDVLIIGTGPAGLTAAYDLITMGAGLDVTILEASNKIGGRMQADTTLTNFPVELGAEWIQVNS